MKLAQTIEQDLKALVRVQTADCNSPITSQYDVEWQQVKQAVPERQREFLWGRALIRQLAVELNIPVGEISSDSNKAPILPQQLAASISHNRQQVIVIAAPVGQVRALGVDIDTTEPIMARLKQRIFTDHERLQCQEQQEQLEIDPFKCLFSAKEGLYKCFYHLTGVKLSFCDISLSFEQDRSLTVRLERTIKVDPAVFNTLRGYWWIEQQQIVTVFMAMKKN